MVALVVAAAAVTGRPAAGEVVEHWAEAYTAPGRIIDVTETALLYRDGGGGVHHVDQEETDTPIPVEGPSWWPPALVADVVIFGEGTGTDGELRLVQWDPVGGRVDLGRVPFVDTGVFTADSPVAVAVEGSLVAFGRLPGGPGPSGLVVRDVASGDERIVTSDLPGSLDVAEDGSVAFVVDDQLLLDRAGVTTELTQPAADTTVRNPRTDGRTTLYAQVSGDLDGDVRSQLRSSRDGVDIAVVGPRDCRLVPYASSCTWLNGYPEAGTDYLVDRGVVAWRDRGIRRARPPGPAEVVSPTQNAQLREIGPAGEVLYENRYGMSGEILWTEQPHVVRPDGRTVAVHRPDGPNLGFSDWATTFAGSELVSYAGPRLVVHDVPLDGAPQVWEQPDDTSAVRGGVLGLAATIGGHPVPDITWERSTDGVTWVPVDPDRSSGGWSPAVFTGAMTFVVTADDEPYRWYRAVGTNEHGAVTTAAAEVSYGWARIVPGSRSSLESRATAGVPIDVDPPFLGGPVTARWRTIEVPGLADQATPGVDYTPASGTVTIHPGTPGTTISIPLLSDAAPEADERIIVQVGDPTGAVMGGFWGLGVATIVDDD